MLRPSSKTLQIAVSRSKVVRDAATVPVIWRKGLNPLSPERKFSPLKMHLYAKYGELVGNNSLLLLLSTRDIPSAVLLKLRQGLIGTTKPRSVENPYGISPGSKVERKIPALFAVRTHMFLAAMRKDPTLHAVQKKVVPLLQGKIAVLSLPTLDPEHLSSVLKVLDRVLPKPSNDTPKSSSRGDDPLAMPPPGGGGVQKTKPPTRPAIGVIGGVVEGRLFYLEGLREITKLPTLQVLHSQIVGLLSSPASQLSAVLQQAAGGRVARALDGFRRSLEDAQEGSGGTGSAS